MLSPEGSLIVRQMVRWRAKGDGSFIRGLDD
jgi:hypothetical protein